MRKHGLWLPALIAAAIFFASFLVGRYSVPAGRTAEILLDALLEKISFGRWGLAPVWTAAERAVVVNVRLPRIFSAALVGAALSAAGASYQGMFRNPMVSPDLLGASTGAGFGAALAIYFGFSYLGITLAAFLFGLAAVLLAYLVSRASRLDGALAMVLAGVMIGSLFTSGTSLIKLVADTENQLPAITYWLMGSLSSAGARDVRFAFWPILLGLAPLLLLRWRVNLLTLPESEAGSMGVDTRRLRAVVILCSTLMTAASVSISGMIGWIGLVVPHFARLLFGCDYRRLLPASAILGAGFLMAVDDLARVMTTSEIPLGILTSFVGAPLFVWLILTGGGERDA
jgi:iron complex transport system permease protein